MSEVSGESGSIAVLMGGPSSEHDISVRSGEQVVQALGARALPVLIGRDDVWRIDGEAVGPVGVAATQLARRVKACFVALHGPFGEDGTVQGVLDACGLPYTGSGVLGSALAMDKVRAKQVYRAAGLPTPGFEAIDRRRWRRHRDATVEAVAQLGWPCVLKPAASGSSYGVHFPGSAEELAAKTDALLSEVELVLAEQRITGAEFSCGVLEDHQQDRDQALPVIEIIPDPDRFEYFDLEAKYTPGATQEITPARIEDALASRMQDLALRAHRALGCRDFSRTDFLLDDAGAPVLLETNTIPGLTAESLLPKSARAAGISFESLIETLVSNACVRGAATFY